MKSFFPTATMIVFALLVIFANDPIVLGAVGGIPERVSALETAVTTLQTTVGSLQTTVGSLQTQLANANTSQTALQTRLATDENTIQSLLAQLATAQGSITSLQTQLATANSSIGNLFGELAQNAAAIALLRAQATKFSYAHIIVDDHGNANVVASSGLQSISQSIGSDFFLTFSSDVTTNCFQLATPTAGAGIFLRVSGPDTSLLPNTIGVTTGFPLPIFIGERTPFIVAAVCPATN
jgi:TolA-binding protein